MNANQVLCCTRARVFTSSPVDRALPCISYAYMEEDLDVARLIATVIDETELAILCRDCEEPDEPAAVAVTEFQNQQERTTA